MTKELKDKFLEFVMKPDTKPFLFKEGQTTRVLNGLSDDGQTPEYWDGAKVLILSVYATSIFKNHIYRCKHLINDKIDEFKEEELDKRFIRNNE